MSEQYRSREPIFNISEKAPLYFSAGLILIHVAVFYGPRSIDSFAAYWGLLKSLDITGQTPMSKATSLIGHGFLHGSWSHVLLNCAMMVIFGVATIKGAKMMQTSKGRAPRGNAVFFKIFFAGVIIGGLGQWAWWALIGETSSALGASGGVSALFASMAWAIGGRAKMIQFGLGWFVLNIIFIFAGPLLTGGAGFAWMAHLAGYVGGAAVAPFLVRPSSAGLSLRG